MHLSNAAPKPESPLSESNEIMRLLDEHRQVHGRIQDANCRLRGRLTAVVQAAVPVPATHCQNMTTEPPAPAPQCELAAMIRELITFGRNTATELENLHDAIRI